MIIPCIVKLFASPDRAVRVRLLERLDDIVPHLTDKVVNEQIFGCVWGIFVFVKSALRCRNICTGFMDINPAIREATVKSMIVLAPKLSHSNINVELMKHFARLQGAEWTVE